MRAAASNELVLASARLRLAASLIDIACVLVEMIGAALGVAALAKIGAFRWLWRSRAAGVVRGWAGPRLERAGQAGPDPTRSARVQIAAYLLGFASCACGRTHRGPGYRALGLRRVDASTGGPVGIRAATVRYVVGALRNALLERLLAPVRRREAARREAAMNEIRDLARAPGRDHEAIARAMKQRHLTLSSSLVRRVLPKLLAICATDLPTLLGANGRSLADQLAGTVVIVER